MTAGDGMTISPLRLGVIALVMFLLGGATVVGFNRLTTAEKIEGSKFEALHRSTVAIASAIDIGVTLMQFVGLLQALQAEASLVAEKVQTGNEKKVLAKYNELVEIYKNSYTLWRADIESHGYSTGISGLPENMIPLGDYQGRTIPAGLVAQIAQQYELKITPVQVQGHSIDTITVASLWEVARNKIAALRR